MAMLGRLTYWMTCLNYIAEVSTFDRDFSLLDSQTFSSFRFIEGFARFELQDQQLNLQQSYVPDSSM